MGVSQQVKRGLENEQMIITKKEMKKNVWKLYEKNHDMLTLKAAFRNYPWVRPIPYNPDLLTM